MIEVPVLVLITMAGYSAGAVLGAPHRRPVLSVVDLLVLPGLWSAVLLLRAQIGYWPAFGAALLLGIAAGAAVLAVGGRHTPVLRYQEEVADGGPLAAWRRFAWAMGNFQGRLIMALLYFLLLPPFALIARWSARRTPTPAAGSWWLPRDRPAGSLDAARKQF